MDFVFGRNNLALTVFVPYDCGNDCAFCTSKAMYAKMGASEEDVAYQLGDVFDKRSFPIRDVVFTGGEPAANMYTLKKLIMMCPPGVNVYINTTLPMNTQGDMLGLLTDCDNIRGINISRHGETLEQDREALKNCADDETLEKINACKPVRVNCVLTGQNILHVADRWKERGVEVSFRKDYTKTTPEELHDPYDGTALRLITAGFNFLSHTQCNVCDTTRFERDGQIVQYHKGLRTTSIITENPVTGGKIVEINDLIIFPDGRFGYDWEGNSLEIADRLKERFRKDFTVIPKGQYLDLCRFIGCGIDRGGEICGGGGSCGGGCGGGGSYTERGCGGGC